MIRTVHRNPVPPKAVGFMRALLERCDPRGNLVVVGRVEGSQTKGLASDRSDIDLTVGFLESCRNLVSMRPVEIDLSALPFERMRKLDLHDRPVDAHLGFLYEGTEVELTLMPLFTKGHIVYPAALDDSPGNINEWIEARSTNELIPQLYFQNGKAIYDMFTAHEAYETGEWTRLKALVAEKFHVSATALHKFFSGYMSSQLRAHENVLGFKSILNVHNVTSSRLWEHMSEEDRKQFHAAVKRLQAAFEKFKAENPVLKGRRWIDFEKRERKALEENRVDPVVKQVLEGTYIGMCGIHFFETGEFHCNYELLLAGMDHVLSREQVELLRACLLHKTGREAILTPPERFLAEVRKPRLEIFAAIQRRLEDSFSSQGVLPKEVDAAMHRENGELLQGYLADATPR